jgi:hypothetical protein
MKRVWRRCAADPSNREGWEALRAWIGQAQRAGLASPAASQALIADLDALLASGNYLCPVDRSFFHQKLFRTLW